jgi:hypothetical protein
MKPQVLTHNWFSVPEGDEQQRTVLLLPFRERSRYANLTWGSGLPACTPGFNIRRRWRPKGQA